MKTTLSQLGIGSLCWLGLVACGAEGHGHPPPPPTVVDAGANECGLIECFRAVECVVECGGPIVTSGCCPCAPGTFDSIECSAGPDVSQLGSACSDSEPVCAPGLSPVKYFGIAGPQGPEFCSCEIACKSGGDCPAGTNCVTIADGPGSVCRIP